MKNLKQKTKANLIGIILLCSTMFCAYMIPDSSRTTGRICAEFLLVIGFAFTSASFIAEDAMKQEEMEETEMAERTCRHVKIIGILMLFFANIIYIKIM